MSMTQPLVAGRYRLLRQLGAGGMGRVWLARDEMLRRDVAIKEVTLPAALAPHERVEMRLRTLREARTAARLNHPNVVKIYDVVHTEEQPWIVMEYVSSRSLQDVISTDGPVTPAVAANIGLFVLAALTAAHQAGVLHRDVKPGNVLLGEDGRVVLTDFGLATFDGGEGALTAPGLVFGSVRYVPPERARDGTHTPESDLWALGATLYAAVEGRSPYERANVLETLTALATALPDPPQNAGALKPVLAGLLRRNPRDRLHPDQVRRLLLRAANAEPARARGRFVPLQRKRRTAIPPAPVPTPPVPRPPVPTPPVSPPVALRLTGGASPDPPATDADPDQVETTVLAGAMAPSAPSPSPPGTSPGPSPGGDAAGAESAGADPPPDGWTVTEPPAEVPARRARLRLVLAGVVIVAVIGALVAVLGNRELGSGTGRHNGAADRGTATGTPAPVVSTAASPILPAGAPGTVLDARACPATDPTPVPSVKPQPGWNALVEGFVWYRSPLGFRIAAPADWLVYLGSTGVCFREPGGWRLLGVTIWTGTDALTHVTQRERGLRAAGAPPGYAKLSIYRVAYYTSAAEWEYTFNDATGAKMHVYTRDFRVRSGKGYTIVWSTRDFDWQLNLDNFNLIVASFTAS